MLDQIFQQQVCICYHSIIEEHFAGECFALDYNGTTYSACRCNRIKLMPLRFSFNLPIPNQDESNKSNQNTKEYEFTKQSNKSSPRIAPVAKSTKSIPLNWGTK